jgi:hypothetical protein
MDIDLLLMNQAGSTLHQVDEGRSLAVTLGALFGAILLPLQSRVKMTSDTSTLTQ